MAFVSILLLILLSACSDTGSGPVGGGSTPALYITSVSSAGATDVVRWRDGMSRPEVIVPNARISGPPANGKIVVTRWNGAESQVVLANSDGSEQRVLFTIGARITCAKLSVDAAFVAYVYDGSLSGLSGPAAEIRPIRGGDPVLLATRMLSDDPLHWSPIANVLAVRLYGVDTDTLITINADGTDRRIMTTALNLADRTLDNWNWARDGRSIYYTSFDEPVYSIKQLDAASGRSSTAYAADSLQIVFFAAATSNGSSFYLSRGNIIPQLLSVRAQVSVLSTVTGELTHLKDHGISILPLFLSASDDDAYLSYGLYDIEPDPKVPGPLTVSDIKVLRRKDNQLIDLGIRGGAGYWYK